MDKLEKQRIYRNKTNNVSTKKYEKTKKGFLMRMYRNMTSRVLGIQYKKKHLYAGKEIIDKDCFYEFALNNDNFNKLFSDWELSEYNRKLTPSIDRIDSRYGYVFGNMQFITHSENSKKGSLNKKKCGLN